MRILIRSLLLLSLSTIGIAQISVDDLPAVLRYETDALSAAHVVPLSARRRREADSGKDDDEDDPTKWTLPPDVTREEDSADHIYYIKNVTSGDEAIKKHFVDIDAMMNQTGVVGNSSHPLLISSYRRAVSVRLTFEFPFYGHKMSNLTIATGGFIYIGDQTHNWLAATQYIAPLMANFDTQLNNSKIIFADDHEKFVVEWRNVQLREQREAGPFTFQVILHKNGDIVFAYKTIPLNVRNISDSHHPVKLGISDAYLFNHQPTDSQVSAPPRRVIYEYHRIEILANQTKSNTVVYLQAQPTCIGFSTCESCANATLKHFTCTWCDSKNDGGPFCTDESGLHRRRQTWIQGNCKDQGKTTYCSASDYKPDEKKSSSESGREPDEVVNLGHLGGASKVSVKEAQGGTGYAALVTTLGLILCIGGWFAYAYYNPHTTSGQLLIRYRPSQWNRPHSHVRYTASTIHM